VSKEYLSKIDTVLLRLDNPVNPMMVTGIMVFVEPVGYDALKNVIRQRLTGIKRFRQKVIIPRFEFSKPYWEDDPNFELDYHLQKAILPPPGDEKMLQELVSILASTPLDFSRPLWQFHLIENYGEGSALICRIHHSIADGMELIQVILSLTDLNRVPPAPTYSVPRSAPDREFDLQLFFKSRVQKLRSIRKKMNSRIQEAMEAFSDPYLLSQIKERGTDAALEMGSLAMLGPDSDTVLRGKLGERKKVAWSEEIMLEDIKVIRERLGGTVNDVLLASMAGALRLYLQRHGDDVNQIHLRAVVPVDMRNSKDRGRMGNQLGAYFLSLPIDIPDPVERLQTLKIHMNGHKDSSQAKMIYFLLYTLGMTPTQLANAAVNMFGNRASVVMTNVKGPTSVLYLAGSEIENIMFWVPSTGPLGVGVSILSYAGSVRLGVFTDEGLVPDPEQIIEGFYQEFNRLFEQALNVDEAPLVNQMSVTLDDAIVKLDAMIEGDDQYNRNVNRSD